MEATATTTNILETSTSTVDELVDELMETATSTLKERIGENKIRINDIINVKRR